MGCGNQLALTFLKDARFTYSHAREHFPGGRYRDSGHGHYARNERPIPKHDHVQLSGSGDFFAIHATIPAPRSPTNSDPPKGIGPRTEQRHVLVQGGLHHAGGLPADNVLPSTLATTA